MKILNVADQCLDIFSFLNPEEVGQIEPDLSALRHRPFVVVYQMQLRSLNFNDAMKFVGKNFSDNKLTEENLLIYGSGVPSF